LYAELSEFKWLKIDQLDIDSEAKITLNGWFPHNKKSQVKRIMTDFVKLFTRNLSIEKFEYAE
jgi:hypothetical protein